MPGKKIGDLDVYDDVNTDKSRRDLLEISKNTGTYGSPTYATNGSRKITIEQLKETLFIKDINSYNQVTTGSPTFDKQSYNGIANAGTYTLPTSVGSYEVLAIILEAELNVTVNGLGTGISDLVFTKQNETAYLIDTVYGWYPLAVNKEVNSSAFELLANKENTTLDTSSTKYPTNNLVKTYVDNLGNTLTSGLATKLTIANNLSDLTNTTQARDNLLLGATNDVTHNSITLSNTTVSTLPFIDSAKKIISATGALLGTWFQTLTAKSAPVDADTIVINDSANSFEAKKTTLTELWTNYLRAFVFSATLTPGRVPKSNGSGVLINSGIFDGGDINGVSFYKTANNSLSIGSPTGQVAIGKFIPVENFGGNFLGDLILIGNNRTLRSHTANSNVANYINIISDAIFTQNRFEEYRSSTDSESPLLDRHITYRKVFTLATNQWTIDNSALNILQLTSTGVIFRNQFYTTTSQRVTEYNENCNNSCIAEFKSSNAGVGLPLVANGSKPTGKKGNFLMNDTNSVLEFTTGTGANWQELAVYKFDELLQITDCNATFSTANTGVYFPFVPKCDMNVTKIFYNLQSAGTDTVRVAIYSDSSNQATTLLVQGSESTTGATTTGQRSITIASTRLLSGTRYWIAIKNDSGVASFLSKNNVYSNNITREGFTSGAFVTTPAPSSSTNAVWLGIGI